MTDHVSAYICKFFLPTCNVKLKSNLLYWSVHISQPPDAHNKLLFSIKKSIFFRFAFCRSVQSSPWGKSLYYKLSFWLLIRNKKSKSDERSVTFCKKLGCYRLLSHEARKFIKGVVAKGGKIRKELKKK